MWPFKKLTRTRSIWFTTNDTPPLHHHLVVIDTPTGGLRLFVDGKERTVLLSAVYNGVLDPDVITRQFERGKAGAL